MNKLPNPQGKGLVPILNELQQFKYAEVAPKSFEKISNEIFTALFVLESHFNFCPRPKQLYYLFKKGDKYFLSLISNKDWGEKRPYSDYIGECQLHEDMAWTLNLNENLSKVILEDIKLKFEKYKKDLSRLDKVDDILPKYVDQISFYQRALLWSLGQSLKASMAFSGYLGKSVDEVFLLEQKNGPK
ncbi:MAG: DUF2452 domain-containing protein [Bacteriovoracaceae bacterium]